MEGLKILDLSNNRLKDVHSNILNNLKKLTELRLSRNFIQELKTGLIQDLRHLRFLYLDNNEIVNIESNSIQSLPKLELIKLNRNNISFIPSYTFNNLSMLQVAELQENSLKAVASNAFNIVPNLLVMNLSHNNFKNFDDIGLPSLRSLEVLDLSYNQLVKMDTNSLQMMEWLVELKIDNNYICEIYGSPFNAMPRLRVVSLRQNKIMHITEQVLDKIRTNIAVFDLDGNPLECNCNIQWLQVWAQESQSVGPRCIDGKLLREIEFITEDCKSRQHIDQIQSICESDSSYYDTSQVFSKYTQFKNISHDVRGNDNSLAPLPEESEYFYDEYVDYPFNQSLVIVPNNTVALSNRNNNGISSTTEKSSHLIPGDTPTIYAASRNKSKPEIPKEVTNSPSSSGFTFFGVPLPNINLNQLWGNGQRTNLKKLDAIPQVADRKSAVMNNPPTAGKFLPLERGTRINNFGPPSVPVIQTGGFFPVLPGSGGFKPIPNPMVLPQPTSQVNVQIRRVNNTFHGGNKASSFPQRKVMNTPGHEIFPQNIQATTKPSIRKRNESYSLRMPSSSTASYDTTSQENKYSIPDFQPASESKKEEIVISENIDIHKKDTNVTRIEFVTIKIDTENVIFEPETTIAPYLNASGNSSNDVVIKEDHDQEQHAADVKDSRIFDDMMPAAHVSIATNINEDNMKSQENNSHFKDVELRNSTEDLELASSLSTLLVPGGQQTQIKPAGRSTITKVPSPHASSIIPVSNNKKTRSHDKENGTGHATEDNDNWYFANYNNSFSEPFVSLSGCGYISVKYISISMIVNVLFVIYSQLYILVI